MLYFLTVNYNSTQTIEKLIDSIKGDRSTYKFIIINNSPEDLSLKQLESKSDLIVESGENIGFGSACNLGLNWIYQRDSQAIVWLINPDAYLEDNNLETAFNLFKSHPSLSIVGTAIYTPEGELWFGGGRFLPHLGAIFDKDLVSLHPEAPYVNCDWVSGCSLIIKLSHFSICPQFDSAYFLYYEDFDFCRRYALDGHQVAITKMLAVIHQPSSITNRNIDIKLRHSTYSYLLTLERYTNKLVLFARLLRLLLNALLLFPFKPQISLGKVRGMVDYWVGDRPMSKS